MNLKAVSIKGRLLPGFVLALAATGPVHGQSGPADSWWSIVALLADDSFEGRRAGSTGYDRAADYVAAEFQRLGLKPAGTDGYFQPLDLVSQYFDLQASSASLHGDGVTMPLSIPQDLYFRGAHPMPATLDAPMVFAGYGLSLPEAGHDDFAGIDVRGKIVLVLSGGPQDIPGSWKANARSERAQMLAERGAVGMITLTSPGQIEIPWSRQMARAVQSSMYLADLSLGKVKTDFLAASFSPDRAEVLFTGAAHSFTELSALADTSQPLPRFDLALRLSTKIVTTTEKLRSANVVALLPGSDPELAAEHVVLSAHLDGLGVGQPTDGDAIYNGAIDNAVGVANVISVARDLVQADRRPRRSILFLIPTAEEMGLLGSRYFVNRPTVPADSLVANINFDMPLPIFPLTSVTPIGYEESTMGDDAAIVSSAMNLPIVPDPFPDRNVFIRSDQYSFVQAGIPALFLKIGFLAETPEAEIEHMWRANIYHSPRDDAHQPVRKEDAVLFNAWATALVRKVADNPDKPHWNEASYFKRFAE